DEPDVDDGGLARLGLAQGRRHVGRGRSRAAGGSGRAATQAGEARGRQGGAEDERRDDEGGAPSRPAQGGDDPQEHDQRARRGERDREASSHGASSRWPGLEGFVLTPGGFRDRYSTSNFTPCARGSFVV